MVAFTPQERMFISRLRAMLELLPPELDRNVAAAGVTSFEFALLDTVSGSPDERLRLSRLANSTNATLPRLSRVMNGLERKGLVERVRDERDARATDARLTDAGRRVLAESRPITDRTLRRAVLEPLDRDQLETVSESLHAILRVLDPDGRLAVTAQTVDGEAEHYG